MATYLPGSNKYIPQIQPYQPDFKYYSALLEAKSAQYDEGYDRVNNIYGTLLNSPLSRQDTSQMRNDFFSKANNEIQRLAGMDLASEDNQRAAFNVFKPLTTNPLFAKDIGYTKSLGKQFDRAEYFKNCINEKECGGKYWDEGVAYLNYQAQEFANADANKALSMAAPEYVPFVNIAKQAYDYLTDKKFEIQTVDSDGRYNYSITNGVPAEVPIHNYLVSMYGNDPNVMKMYQVSSYLQRKQYGEENAEAFGSAEAAEQDYVNKVINQQSESLRKYKEEVDGRQREINARKAVADNYITTQGVDPELDADFMKYYQSLNGDAEITKTTNDYYSGALEETLPSSIQNLEFDALAQRADNILAMSLFDLDMAEVSSAYARATQKIEKDVDEIYLTQLKHQNSLSEISAKASVQSNLEDKKHANALEKLYWEAKLGKFSSKSEKDGKPKIDKTTVPGLNFLTDGEKKAYEEDVTKKYSTGWSIKMTDPYENFSTGDELDITEEEAKRLQEQGYVLEEVTE